MAIRIESKRQIEEIKGEPIARRILFFIPPELWMGEYSSEGHKSVLEQTGRSKEQVAVAGFIWYYEELEIDGKGSEALDIKPKDPTPIIEYYKSLPE
jgi:preprotein translocase subunit Sec61beta